MGPSFRGPWSGQLPCSTFTALPPSENPVVTAQTALQRAVQGYCWKSHFVQELVKNDQKTTTTFMEIQPNSILYKSAGNFGFGRVTFQSESTFSGKAVISFLQGTMFFISAQLDIGSSSLHCELLPAVKLPTFLVSSWILDPMLGIKVPFQLLMFRFPQFLFLEDKIDCKVCIFLIFILS